MTDLTFTLRYMNRFMDGYVFELAVLGDSRSFRKAFQMLEQWAVESFGNDGHFEHYTVSSTNFILVKNGQIATAMRLRWCQ